MTLAIGKRVRSGKCLGWIRGYSSLAGRDGWIIEWDNETLLDWRETHELEVIE